MRGSFWVAASFRDTSSKFIPARCENKTSPDETRITKIKKKSVKISAIREISGMGLILSAPYFICTSTRVSFLSSHSR